MLFPRLTHPLIFGLSLICLHTLKGQGPGLPNLDYSGKSPMDTLSLINSSIGVPNGHGFVSMHRGYLMVIFSNDGGGGDGSGGFAFLDISNPEAPQKVFSTRDSSQYTSPTSPHYAGDLAESHGHTLSGDILCMTFDSANSSGIQFWDLSNPNSSTGPKKLSELPLSSLKGGDYNSKAWWVTWQGRYAYVGGTDAGLFIVDAADPANPKEIKRIPTEELGGFNIHSCVAVGNLLVLARAEESNINPGVAILEISDPENPNLLYVNPLLDVGYSVMVNGNRLLAADNPIRVYDLSDPANPSLMGRGQNVSGKGGYGMAQDEYFILGSSTHVLKMDLSQRDSANDYLASGVVRPAVAGADWDFAVPLGNMIFGGNDHGDGSALLVSQIAPDTRPPEVNMVSPQSDAVNQDTRSRIGLTFTDQIDKDSINASSIIIRPFGGNPLSGTYTTQTGIVNFSPDQPLQENKTYEIVLPAGGIKDYAGNALETTFTSRFSTGENIVLLGLEASGPGAIQINTQGAFTATSLGSSSTTYAWNFGDGSPTTTPSTHSQATHTYSEPGNYTVQVTATEGSRSDLSTFTQVVHRPLSDQRPTQSSSIIYDPENNYVWSVNPDNDSVTAIDALTLTAKWEIPVGKNPRTLALGQNHLLVVACKEEASLHLINRETGTWIQAVYLPYGSQPFGLTYSPALDAAYVSLEASQMLLKLNPTTLAIVDSLHVGPTPRGIAIDRDGKRLLLTRFISPDEQAEVIEVDLTSFTITQTIGLRIDPGPDDEDQGRGLPNYLSSIAISPDNTEAWIPSKKDNIERGLNRDGNPLTFESTVRGIVSQIDLSQEPATEITEKRHDFNDRAMASAITFNPLGNLAFVATQGTSTIEILDAYSGILRSGMDTGGRAPQGLVINPAGTRLFVQNFMSRDVSVFEIGDNCEENCGNNSLLATISTVSNEALPPLVFQGKQIFYNAADSRINRDKYISCAACHLDGDQDGRNWDFTDRGEGIRNTISLKGKGGAQGRVHWSANFDEIQDFEHDIRNAFGGSGLMNDADFFAQHRNIPLGTPKAGVSPELDALAAYVHSLLSVPDSPYRESSGEMTASALAGELLFENRCSSCHGGDDFTDSSLHRVHDVGTLSAASGKRLGKTLAGIDTPGLRGVWATAPYLHDGSAPTLREVLTTRNPEDKHGITSDLSETEIENLIEYLLQLDGQNTPFPLIGNKVTDSDDDSIPDTFEEINDLDPYFNDSEADPDDDGSNNLNEYYHGTDAQNEDSDDDGLLDGVETNTGIYVTLSNTGTDPLKKDSDNDGFFDGFEVTVQSDPNDPDSLPPGSGFALLEDFESYTIGNSITNGTRWSGRRELSVGSAPDEATGKIGITAGVSGPYDLSTDFSDLAIKEGEVGTLFFRLRTNSAGTTDLHLGIADEVTDLAFADYYYQMGLKHGTIVGRDANSERVIGSYETDVWYKIWMVFDTLNNRCDIYIQGGTFTVQTLLASNFGQRKSGQADLNAFRIKAADAHGANDVVLIDDLYLAPASENLHDPTLILTAPTIEGLRTGETTEIDLSALNPALEYTLQRAQNLGDPWTNIFTGYSPNSTIETFIDPNPPEPPVFYRIKVTFK